MQVFISHVSYVKNFIDNYLDIKEVNADVIDYIQEVFGPIPTEYNWDLFLRATYTNSKSILISKNKFGNYVSEKQKEVTIPIPIPLIDEVEWGINNNMHIYENSHYDKIIQNFNALAVDLKKYSSMQDYIKDTLRLTFDFIYQHDYTVGGVSLKEILR